MATATRATAIPAMSTGRRTATDMVMGTRTTGVTTAAIMAVDTTVAVVITVVAAMSVDVATWVAEAVRTMVALAIDGKLG